MKTADYWISHLQLQPHPEGGFFRETYRSQEYVATDALPARFLGHRDYSTAIYFLLQKAHFSAFHRIASDEMWHFYTGAELTVFIIHPDGKNEEIKLGADAEKGQVFQAVVPHSSWFGAKITGDGDYALLGCTVSPGFDFADFEMADRTMLLKQFPQHSDIIVQLTHA